MVLFRVKMDNALGRGFLVIDKTIPQCVLGFSVVPIANLLSRYGHFWIPINKMLMAVMPKLRLQICIQMSPSLLLCSPNTSQFL